MEVEFHDDALDDLERNPHASGGLPQAAVRGYRKAMQAIRAAQDERDLYKMRGLRLEKLRGDRKGQHSLRCNDQYRLIVNFAGTGPGKVVQIVEITDYH